MKKIIIILSLFLFIRPLFAGEKADANIREGNVQVGGSLSALRNQTGGATTYNFNPSAQYFLIDNVSAGLSILWASHTVFERLGVGPVFSWHFFESRNSTVHLKEEILNFTDRYYPASGTYTTSYWVFNTSVGLNYFIVPFVSVGPELTYVYDSSSPKSSNGFILTAAFSIFF